MVKRQKNRNRRHNRVRAKIRGSHDRPRLCVFRSNKYTYAQLVDDSKGVILMSVTKSDLGSGAGEKSKEKGGKIGMAYNIGQTIAEGAKNMKIEKVVFDRGGYRYHGRVKALAEGARKGGLRF